MTVSRYIVAVMLLAALEFAAFSASAQAQSAAPAPSPTSDGTSHISLLLCFRVFDGSCSVSFISVSVAVNHLFICSFLGSFCLPFHLRQDQPFDSV